jgi:hypothetical protein
MKTVPYVTSIDGIRYEIRGNRLIEVNFFDRTTNLATLGKILRTSKATKTTKNARIYYAPNSASGKGFLYAVPVNAYNNYLAIGCVRFTNENAQKLRRYALKLSKVAA